VRYRRVAIRIRGSLSTTIVTSRMPTHLFWKNSWLCFRQKCPRTFVTTNNVGPPVDYIDLRELYKNLDFVAFDNYPGFLRWLVH